MTLHDYSHATRTHRIIPFVEGISTGAKVVASILGFIVLMGCVYVICGAIVP